MMTRSEISFSFKARYVKLGEINSATKQIWFVLHGYGQLAPYFIKNFSVLKEHNICVIAPEGLSRFYLQDVTSRIQTGNNRVGATWMTKEERLTDIENYLNYLDHIYAKEIGRTSIPITLLGFSQGAATASRWIMNKPSFFNRLILWAGLFPPDIDFALGSQLLKNKEVFFVYGERDPFLTDSRFAEQQAINEKLHVKPTCITFNGAHQIDEHTLLKFI